MKFYPIESKSAASQYWGSEAAYAKQLSDFGSQVYPGRKDMAAPTKAWVSFGPARYTEYNTQGQQLKPGYLTIAEGQTVKPENQGQRIDQLTTYVWIIPQVWARFLSGVQLRFIIEYRNHEAFRNGFPGLVPCLQARADDTAWLSQPNFYAAAGHPVEPMPVGLPSNWFLRWKPGTGDTAASRTLANVEVFPIEDFVREYGQAPPDVPVTAAGEYAFAEADLVGALAPIMFGNGDNTAKGRAIRELVERRK